VALQDPKGRPRLTLLLIDGHPTVALSDAEGVPRLHLRVDGDGCGFDLVDADRPSFNYPQRPAPNSAPLCYPLALPASCVRP
jgi:hypothetical protein